MPLPNLRVAHFELYVADLQKMEQFYTELLGFFVTDRDRGPEQLVFLSRHPEEHHQIVFNSNLEKREETNRLHHLAFQVNSLSELRAYYSAISQAGDCSLEMISHGTTWSIYFSDPEKNRFEIFTNTPWYVEQPLRFPIDLNVPDEELFRITEEKIKKRPKFQTYDQWFIDHQSHFSTPSFLDK